MSKNKRLVLLVDDSPSVVQSLASVLHRHDFVADTALNGSDALRKILQKPYDVVVCDVEMPQMSGLDFLAKVHKDGHNVDVILMTGYMEAEYFVRAIRDGAADFISKPVEPTQLIRSIEGIISTKENKQGLSDLFQKLDNTEIRFVIDPTKVAQHSITKAINKFMQKHVLVSSDTMTELLTCIDEMLQNAYIHGTLALTPEQRHGDHAAIQKIVAEKMTHPEIASKRVYLSLALDQIQDTITIQVSDKGEGFDYESWLLRLSDGHKLSLEEHGRGLAVLYHLSDSLEFDEGGRQVKITRKLNQNQYSQG